MEKCCKDCKHFHDAHYSKTYITPVCLAHGGDDASFFRQYICGLDNPKLFEPKPSLPTHEESVSPD